jgi:hypothetical protein
VLYRVRDRVHGALSLQHDRRISYEKNRVFPILDPVYCETVRAESRDTAQDRIESVPFRDRLSIRIRETSENASLDLGITPRSLIGYRMAGKFGGEPGPATAQ